MSLKGGTMKRILVFAIAVIILAGCCPAKKPPQKTPVTTPGTGAPTETSTATPGTTSSGAGTATPTEVKVATAGGGVPLTAPSPETEFVEPTGAAAEILKPVYFDFDKYSLRPDAQKILKNVAKYLLDNPKVLVAINGYCDERGTDEYNLVLGEQRALSARNFLIGMGVSPKRLFTVSYGKAQPADPAHTEDAWTKNRRDEFKVSKN
jgi:peptidoglycan-associated lipoprotein